MKNRANLKNNPGKFVYFGRKSEKLLSYLRKSGLKVQNFMQLRGIDQIWYAIKRDF